METKFPWLYYLFINDYYTYYCFKYFFKYWPV